MATTDYSLERGLPAAIEAERNFWLAETSLEAALIGGSSVAPESTTTASAAGEPGGH